MAGLCAAANAQPHTRIRPLIVEGDVITIPNLLTGIPDTVTVATVENIVVNNDGDWMCYVGTNFADSNRNGLLMKNGLVVFRERDPIAGPTSLPTFPPSPPEYRVSIFLDSDVGAMNNAGDFVYPLSTVDVTPGNDASTQGGMYYNGNDLIKCPTPISPPGFPDQFVYEDQTGYFDPPYESGTWFIPDLVEFNDNRQVFTRTSIRPLGAGDSLFASLLRLDLDAAGDIASQQVLRVVGDAAPHGGFWASFQTGLGVFAFNNPGDYMFIGSSDQAEPNSVIMKNGTILAQQGQPSIIAGRNWDEMNTSTFPALDLNNNGDWFARINLDGATTDDDVLLFSGALVLREGGTLPPFGSTYSKQSGSDGVGIDDAGRGYFMVDTPLADTTTDEGLVRVVNPGTPGQEFQALVREGVTTILTGEVVEDFPTGEGVLKPSNNGRVVGLVMQLPARPGSSGFAQGAFAVLVCPADTDNNGLVDADDIFGYLALWFEAIGPCPIGSACLVDVDNDRNVTADDIFSFLSDWFASIGPCS